MRSLEGIYNPFPLPTDMTNYFFKIRSRLLPEHSQAIRSTGQLLAIWLALRIASSLFASFVSYLRPITEIEQRIPLLPPSQPITVWLNRAFLSPWLRWDAAWFVRIVTQGYHPDDGTALFHPLYPWLATPLYHLHLDAVFALLIVGAIAAVGLIISFQHLSALDLTAPDLRFSVLLLLFAPPAFVLFAPYTEGLFLFLAVLCLLSARKGSWWLAGLAGGLATLTRQQGVFLIIPLLWTIWDISGHKLRNLLKDWKLIFPVSLIPSGLLFWMLYRLLKLGEIKFISANPISLLSSLITPNGSSEQPIQGLVWPWLAIKVALGKLTSQPDLDIWVNTILGAGFLVLLALAWKRMNWSYRLYALAITLVSFSFNTGVAHPYMGLPRHLLLAIPVFIGVAPIFNTSWKRLTVIAISAIGWFVLLLLFGLETWVP